MKTKSILLIVVALCVSTGIFAQGVGINGTGAQPHTSAALDIDFTDKGVLIPRLTTAQRDAISTPGLGLMVYNTDDNCINMWDGSTWKQSCFDCTFAAPVVANNSPVCEGSTLNLTATTISGATYSWTGPNGFSSSSQNPSIPGATTAASGTYALTATLNGCTSAPIYTTVTINSIPSPPTAGNTGPVCLGSNVTLTASTLNGASYNWTGPNAFTANVQNPVLSNVAFSDAGTYQVTATINGCTSAAASTSVNVINTPSAPGTISGVNDTCSGTTGAAYSISAVAGATSYAWTVPAGSSVASGQGTNSITVNFGSSSGDICVAASNACGTSGATCKSVTLQGASGSQTFNPTGSIVTWTVPGCVSTGITIEAWGAQGGSNVPYNGHSGGKGAYIKGDFSSLNGGTVLKILVGQEGTTGCSGPNCSNGSGGGGSFIWEDGQTALPLIAAAGGGGSTDWDGGAGSASTTPTSGQGGSNNGSGGSGGNGGAGGGTGSSYPSAGGGCGWLSNGGNGQVSPEGGGGQRPLLGGAGGYAGTYGAVGGFGGGGGSAGHRGAGGGGGGYNGGGGGSGYNGSTWGSGGGGGSFNNGTNQTNTAGNKTGNGQVTISW